MSRSLEGGVEIRTVFPCFVFAREISVRLESRLRLVHVGFAPDPPASGRRDGSMHMQIHHLVCLDRMNHVLQRVIIWLKKNRVQASAGPLRN